MSGSDLPIRDDVRPVWVADHWDGPLSGLARSGGELLWFEADVDEDGGAVLPHRYRLRRLADDDLAAVQRVHADFEVRVGTHCCWHPLDGPRAVATTVDESFYDDHPPDAVATYEHAPVVATFTHWQPGTPFAPTPRPR